MGNTCIEKGLSVSMMFLSLNLCLCEVISYQGVFWWVFHVLTGGHQCHEGMSEELHCKRVNELAVKADICNRLGIWKTQTMLLRLQSDGLMKRFN